MIGGIFQNPTKVFFGKETLHLLKEALPVRSNGILIVRGGDSYMTCGAGEFIRKVLQGKKMRYIELGNVCSNPEADFVYRGIRICREENIDFILAVGGGSVIDTAKAIAIGVPYDGDFFELFEKKLRPSKALPVGVILTIPGSGSETSCGAVITHRQLARKLDCSSDVMYPVFAFLNPEFSITVPEYLTSCGIVDAISHLLERFFSNTDFVETTDHIICGLAHVLMSYALKLKKQPLSYDFRAEVMWACKLSHDNTAGFGRKQDWGSHGISHEINLFTTAPHGAILSLVFPAWMRLVAKYNPTKNIEFSRCIMQVDSTGLTEAEYIEAGIKKYEAFLKKLGMPGSLRALNISESDLPIISQRCGQLNPSGTIGNYYRLDSEEILSLLKSIF